LASIALAVLIFVSFRLHATTTTAALLFFVFIVLISLWARFVMSLFGCILAALCFNYFFAFPIFDLRVSVSRDIVLVIALSTTGLVMSCLVTRVWFQADYGIFYARRFLKETQAGRNLNYWALWAGYKV